MLLIACDIWNLASLVVFPILWQNACGQQARNIKSIIGINNYLIYLLYLLSYSNRTFAEITCALYLHTFNVYTSVDCIAEFLNKQSQHGAEWRQWSQLLRRCWIRSCSTDAKCWRILLHRNCAEIGIYWHTIFRSSCGWFTAGIFCLQTQNWTLVCFLCIDSCYHFRKRIHLIYRKRWALLASLYLFTVGGRFQLRTPLAQCLSIKFDSKTISFSF